MDDSQDAQPKKGRPRGRAGRKQPSIGRVHNPLLFDDVPELARYLRIATSTAYKGLNSGAIPARRIGSKFVISREAIDEWLRTAGNGHTSLGSS